MSSEWIQPFECEFDSFWYGSTLYKTVKLRGLIEVIANIAIYSHDLTI